MVVEVVFAHANWCGMAPDDRSRRLMFWGPYSGRVSGCRDGFVREAVEIASGRLDSDAAAPRLALDHADAATMVSRSCGGTVIAGAGRYPAMKSLLYISSYLPHAGQSQGDIMSDEPVPVRVKLGRSALLEVEGGDVSLFG